MAGAIRFRGVVLDDATSKYIEKCLVDVANTTDLTEAGKKELISSIFSRVIDLAQNWIQQIQQEVQGKENIYSFKIPENFHFNYTRTVPEKFHSGRLICQILQDKFKLVPTLSCTVAYSPRSGTDFLLQARAYSDMCNVNHVEVNWSKGNPFIYQTRRNSEQRVDVQKKHLEKEWEQAQKRVGTDIVFSFKDEQSGETRELFAHKAKLVMHSEFFAAKFQGAFLEAKEGAKPVEINDYSFETFQTFLQLVYTANLDLKSEKLEPILELYRCADFYQVNAAKDWCLEAMVSCTFESDDKRTFFRFINHTNFQKLQDIAQASFNQIMLEILQNAVELRDDLKEFDPSAKQQENGSGSNSKAASSKSEKVETLD